MKFWRQISLTLRGVLFLLVCTSVFAQIDVEELKIRAEAGDKSATRQLAETYYLGRNGVEQNFSEAVRWYLKLAQQGDVRAQTTVGLMYLRGYGVPRDPVAAHHWWSFAAAANDPGAQYDLGTLYLLGEGVQQDYAQAARWYQQAAQRGHLQAQHDLGMLYYQGRGIERDVRSAYYWLKVAALQGDEKAEEHLKLVGSDLNADEIRQAEVRAEEWMKKLKKSLK